VERETILQSALALGQRLLSLAGLEFARPGGTSPGLEKPLPGADAYMRANYPVVDGLDRLFMGYISELAYADGNRRGFLDLNVTTDQVNGAFHLLSGTNPLTNAPACAIETVTGSADLSLALAPVLDSSTSSPPRPSRAPWCSAGKPTSIPSLASTMPSMPRAWARCRRQPGGPW
jgi:hypothetical protein